MYVSALSKCQTKGFAFLACGCHHVKRQYAKGLEAIYGF